MILTILMFATGLVALFFGGDWLVKGASGVARHYRVPPLVIGLTIVGFGTSTPELLVSVLAAIEGSPEIAIGNALGSNTANILVILGLSMVVGTLIARFELLRSDLGWMMLAALSVLPIFWDGMVTRLEGAFLVLGIVAYVLLALRQVGSHAEAHDAPPLPSLGLAVGHIALGLVVLMVGAQFLVDSAIKIATWAGISEAVIGLTIVAVGTSLPELATSMVAAFRGHRDIAIGNVIGSNIYNIFAILGLTALVMPIEVKPQFLTLDVPVMLAASLLLIGLIVLLGRLNRLVGVAFLALYGVYVWYLLHPPVPTASGG
jgi:cation:H+ antiporter